MAVQNPTPTSRQELQLPADAHGVVVTNVDPDSPAAWGLEEGDIIVSIHRHELSSLADFSKLAAKAQGKVPLRVIRRGQAASVVISSEDNDGP